MSGINGATVGTPTSPRRMKEEINPVLSVNGNTPDENGNVEVQGGAGVDGKDGVTFTPHVDIYGNLSWTNDGGRTNPDTVNIQGPEGPQGDRGPRGYTGEDGQDGQRGADGEDGVGIASMSYTASNADGGENELIVKLDNGTSRRFVIKNGSKGSTGATGATGPAGKDGKDGSDATVTADNIKSALGYTPADAADLTALNNEKVALENKVDALPNNETLIDNVAEVVKSEVPLVKTAEQPTFVNSIDEMTDTSKIYLMPDGYLYSYMKGDSVTVLRADDFILGALNTSGVVYGTGKTRILTKDALPLVNSIVSVYRPTGYIFLVYFYNSNTPSADSLVAKTAWRNGDVEDITTLPLASGSLETATHCRISFRNNDVSDGTDLTNYFDAFVVNDSVVLTSEDATNQWANTGFSYNQPADYEDRVVRLERILEGLEYVAF